MVSFYTSPPAFGWETNQCNASDYYKNELINKPATKQALQQVQQALRLIKVF